MDHHTIKKQHALLYRTDDGLVEIRRLMSTSERIAFFRQHNLTNYAFAHNAASGVQYTGTDEELLQELRRRLRPEVSKYNSI